MTILSANFNIHQKKATTRYCGLVCKLVEKSDSELKEVSSTLSKKVKKIEHSKIPGTEKFGQPWVMTKINLGISGTMQQDIVLYFTFRHKGGVDLTAYRFYGKKPMKAKGPKAIEELLESLITPVQ